MTNRQRIAAGLMAFSLWSGQMVLAQEAGRLSGRVEAARDGEPIAGVTVVVVGTLYAAVTDATGAFALAPVPAGSYTMEVQALGYRPAREDVVVTAGQETNVTLRLLLPEADLEADEQPQLRAERRPLAVLEGPAVRQGANAEAGALLRTLPGLGASRQGALMLAPRVRGLFDDQLGFFVDGARHLAGSPYDLFTVPGLYDPNDLASMTVVKGPQALTWGGGALGAVWIEPKDAIAGRHELMAGYTGNYGRYEAGGTFGGTLGDAALRVHGRYLDAGAYEAGDGREVPSAVRDGHVRGRVQYAVNSASRLTLAAGYVERRDAQADARLVHAGRVRVMDGSARFQRAWAAGLLREVDAQVYGNRGLQALNNLGKPLVAQVPLLVDTEQMTVGGRLVGHLAPASELQVEIGIDGYQTRVEDVRRIDDDILEVTPPDRHVGPDARQTAVGVFGHARRDFGRVDAAITLRLDRVASQAEPGAASREAHEEAGTMASGAMTLTTHLTPGWTLSLGLGSVARAASVYERYAEGQPYGRTHQIEQVWGAPDLEPERSTQIDLWLAGSLSGIDLNLSGFARRISRYIVPVHGSLSNQPMEGFRYANGEATAWGVEGTAAYPLVDEFATLMAQAAYQWGREEDSAEPLLGIAPLTLAGGGRLQAPANLFFIEGWLRGAAKKERVAVRFGEPTTNAYMTAEAHLGVSLPRGITLRMGIDNLFDATYEDALNGVNPFQNERLPEPGRTFYVRLHYGLF